MIPVDTICSPTRPPGRRGVDCRSLLAGLRPGPGRSGEVLSLTFFVDATETDDLGRRRSGIASCVREAFGPEAPPFSVVAQAPEGGAGMALEAVVLADPGPGIVVRRRVAGGLTWTLVEGNDVRQLHAAGIVADAGAGDAGARAREAIAGAEAVLAAEHMDFGNVIRQWNYLEGMLELRPDGMRQGYQAFNDARSIAYGKCAFPHGYPASTGIGQAAGGILIEFVAVDGPADVRVAPISNPRQIDAHRYSEGVLIGEPLDGVVGKTMPKFERAKRVVRGGESVVFVSGTAAILGERSVGIGDVAAQTRTTIENISVLVGGEKLTCVRGYVKRAEDIPVVRRVCEEAYGDVPALFVKADVCRDELLVEIEGSLTQRGKSE